MWKFYALYSLYFNTTQTSTCTLNYSTLNLSKITKLFPNKSSMYCIIRHQYFNKIYSEKYSDFNWRLWVNQERTWTHFFTKVYSGIVPHLSFTDIHRMVNLIRFTYSSIAVGFRAFSISILEFLCQKKYPGEFSRLEFILSISYLRRCCI